jgi:hypothetical protein
LIVFGSLLNEDSSVSNKDGFFEIADEISEFSGSGFPVPSQFK